MRYIIWLKKDAKPADILGWKEKVKNTPGVTVIDSVETDTLVIESDFDAINLLCHQLDGICNFEEDLQTRLIL